MGVLRCSDRPSRRVRIGEKLLIAVFVVVMIHSAAVIEMRHRVDSELMALRQQGYPVTVSDIAYPSAPAAENAAAVYRRVFPRLGTEELRNLDGALVIWLQPGNPLGNPLGSPLEWHRARITLANYRDIPPLVEKAEARPYCRFPLRETVAYPALLPHAESIEIISNLLIADARIAASAHHDAEAYHLITLAIRLEGSLRDDPMLVSQHVRFGLISRSSRALTEIATPDNVSLAGEREAAKALAGIDVRSSLTRALIMERTLGIELFQAVRRRPIEARAHFAGHRFDVPRVNLTLEGSYLWRPFVYADELAYLHRMSRQIETVSTPGRYQDEQTIGARDTLPVYAEITRNVAELSSAAARDRDAATARAAGARIFLALLSYKARFHGYPETLNALSGIMGEPIPEDPCSGKGFLYRRQGSGFFFYSVGPDARDDGGRGYPDGLPRSVGPTTSPGPGHNFSRVAGCPSGPPRRGFPGWCAR